MKTVALRVVMLALIVHYAVSLQLNIPRRRPVKPLKKEYKKWDLTTEIGPQKGFKGVWLPNTVCDFPRTEAWVEYDTVRDRFRLIAYVDETELDHTNSSNEYFEYHKRFIRDNRVPCVERDSLYLSPDSLIIPFSSNDSYEYSYDDSYTSNCSTSEYRIGRETVWMFDFHKVTNITINLRLDIEHSPLCSKDYLVLYIDDLHRSVHCSPNGRLEQIEFRNIRNLTIKFLSDEDTVRWGFQGCILVKSNYSTIQRNGRSTGKRKSLQVDDPVRKFRERELIFDEINHCLLDILEFGILFAEVFRDDPICGPAAKVYLKYIHKKL